MTRRARARAATAHRFAVDHYSWRSIGDRLLAIYDEALAC